MFNTSTTLLQSKKHNPKHFTSIFGIVATLIPFQIVVIDDEKETTIRLAMEQPRHFLRFFIASSHLSLLKLLPQLTFRLSTCVNELSEVPVITWVLYNIFQLAVNPINKIRNK
ncbi:unnamed protein product [Lactuca saligna]|uniref:Uncharacterized protein n=1 Tax=Lactuca saligna TaxID=75948 RepID=A0AA36EJ24_LACSI|nr:unnamed protein product [Lactuca saligna]